MNICQVHALRESCENMADCLRPTQFQRRWRDRMTDDNSPNAWIAVNAIAAQVADRRADYHPPYVIAVPQEDA